MSNIYDKMDNWAEKAVGDALKLANEDSMNTTEIEKKAIDLGIGAAAVMGTLLGLGVGGVGALNNSKKWENQYGNSLTKIMNDQKRNMNAMGNDYYSQLSNINEDLRVLFTPFSVIFKLRNTVVDTISTDTMNAAMKDAYTRRDAEYFKNVLVNKVYLDSQVAEQLFTKRMLDRDKSFRNFAATGKEVEASYDNHNIFTEDGPVDVIELVKFSEQLNKIADGSKGSELMDKYATALLTAYTLWDEVSIPIDLGPCRYASDLDFDLGIQKLALFNIGDRSEVNMGVISPDNLKNHLTVAYLPDRVLFLSNNTVITSLETLHMNDEGYDKFRDRDDKFFKHLFIQRMNKEAEFYSEEESKEVLADEVFADEVEEITKEASVSSPNSLKKEIFEIDNISPLVYKMILNNTVGDEWKTWDIESLDDILMDTFNVSEIKDIPLNKIMFLITLENSDSPFTGFHTFEKMVRTFNNREINFLTRESNISAGEIISALHTTQDLLHDTDINIYDDISEHVLNYIVEVLVDRNCRVLHYPCSTKFESIFIRLVNIDLDKYWGDNLPEGITSTMNGADEARILSITISDICDKVHPTNKIDYNDIHKIVMDATKKSFMDNDIYHSIITSNVTANLAIPVFVKNVAVIAQEQITKYVV